MIKTYQKYIAENKNLIYISTFVVILLRIGFLFSLDIEPQINGGFFWDMLSPYIHDKYVSFTLSLLFTIGIGLQLTYLNSKYVLIRGKTFLPYVFTIFLLSCYPQLIYLQPSHIGIVAILISIDVLYSSYQQAKASVQAFSIGFILATGSIVTPTLLIYLIIFWIGFYQMRSLSFKTVLASLLGVAMIYWLVFMGLLYFEKADDIIQSLTNKWNMLREIAILKMDVKDIITLTVYFILIVIVLADNYMNEFKDKIQVRVSFSFLRLLLLLSALMYFFLSLHSQLNLMVIFTISGFIFAHFFALAEKKWKIYFSIIIAFFYGMNYVYFLLT